MSCLGNVYEPILGGQELVDQLINLFNHSKPLIRKKAFAALRIIFEQNDGLIGDNVDKVIVKLKEEKDDKVISVILNSFFTVLKKQPQYYPMLIKPLYELLESNKNNWALIKLVKLVR